jgi:hypothetical protein
MKCCLFVGPTLRADDRALLPGAVWLTPVRQSDIYRIVTLLDPDAIGIIDGYFQWVPAVWHKEILWALARGIHVFGAASMGALRAAELARYGMRGVGRIFDAYVNGVLEPFEEPFEDDDEVAVVHGPADYGFLAASDAMVNIRVSLIEAARQGVIDQRTCQRLAAIAKALFYPERTYERVLREGRGAGVAAAQLGALEAWLPSGRVDQKRADAIEMIDVMNKFLAAGPKPFEPGFRFEPTMLWGRAADHWTEASAHMPDDAQVLRELRLQGGEFFRCWHIALGALLPILGVQREPNLQGGQEHKPKLAHARLDDQVYSQVPSRMVVEGHVLDQLRHSGEYAKLLARAHDKCVRLSSQGRWPRASMLHEVDSLRFENWYFTTCLDIEIPGDLNEFLAGLGFSNHEEFVQAIYEEFLYRELLAAAAPAPSSDMHEPISNHGIPISR